ncbi:MAG: pirin family protein [Pseudomonadota bacterium]|nr:pirin family protein [Pseudomonadota bacterium]
MKTTFRPSTERGHTNFGWLKSAHTFSFGEYFDSKHMNHKNLRVINDDKVAPGEGFGTHPHQNAEIITYVLEGALAHKDSMGNGSTIKAGDVQYMSAGSGVTHSEYNASQTEGVHFLQIWVLPNMLGTTPEYKQISVPVEKRMNAATLLVSGSGQADIQIKQDIEIYGVAADGSSDVSLNVPEGHNAYIHMATGETTVAGKHLSTGDGLIVSQSGLLTFTNNSKTQALVFIQPEK